MRILQKATYGGLGKGNLGVFMARAGVGKTACLIHVALDCLFKNQKVIHVGIGETIANIQIWYQEILTDLAKAFDLKDPQKLQEEAEQNRLILSYTTETFTVNKLSHDFRDIAEEGGLVPDVLLIDGFDFENLHSSWDTLAAFKHIAVRHNIEIWFSARTHRESNIQNERGIPAPCHDVDDLFSVILFLEPLENTIHLKLLKDHEHVIKKDLPIKLDPSTLLLLDE